MFENQLEFSNKINKEYFNLNNEEDLNLRNSYTNQREFEDLKNYERERHVVYRNDRDKFIPHANEIDEQLEYFNMNKNIFPEQKPVPLHFENYSEKISSKRSIAKYKSAFKTKKSHLRNKIKKKTNSNRVTTEINQKPNYFNLNNPIRKGLFDPGLKKNELDFAKKTSEQRHERLQKIKNYDLKFGNKIKKFEMYNNYLEMLEDLENRKVQDNLSKEKIKQREVRRVKEDINSKLESLPKPKVKKNNLEFDFSSHEAVIKSLEEQIANERKMRAEIKLKYEQEVKMYDRIKNALDLGKENKLVTNLDKTTNYSNNYKPKSVAKKNKKHFSVRNVRNTAREREDKFSKSVIAFKTFNKIPHSHRRNKSVDSKVRNKIEDMKPKISRIVDRSFNSVYKNLLHKGNNLKKRFYAGKDYKTQDKPDSNGLNENNGDFQNIPNMNINVLNNPPTKGINDLNVNTNKNQNVTNFNRQYQLNEEDLKNYNYHEINVPSSTLCNLDSPQVLNNIHLFKSNINKSIDNKTLNNNNHLLFSRDIPIIDAPQTLKRNQLEDKFESNDKHSVLYSLNQQVANYSKGLPALIEKVETTLNKISKINPLDYDSIPTVVKMASKHSGTILQLHMEEICDMLLDDLLYECVDELQKIEDTQNKREEIKNFKEFIDDYFKNFEMMKNFEKEISENLMSRNYLEKNQIKPSQINYEKIENNDRLIAYRNPFENSRHRIEAHNVKRTNPNIILSEEIFTSNIKRKYSTKISSPLIKNCENYSKEYFDYMKTTGSFLLPNIFILYDEIVKEFVNEILSEELDYCVKQLDSFVTEMYKEEVFKN